MKKFEILKQEYFNILSELDESFFNIAYFWQVNLIIIGQQKIKL